MSDSENDLLQNNFYTFQQESSIISARGPNINRTLTNKNFGANNMLTSTMIARKNTEGFLEPSYYNNSMYNRRDRDTSPMSMRSIPILPRQNCHNSYNRSNAYSQRSIMNPRGGSPMSIRSFDSTASIRAVDIAMAFKEGQFNKYDLRIIKEAYHHFIKSRMRRKIEKKRKKRFRSDRLNSYDSGEDGSDSSISNDCQSVKTTTFKDNMSSCRSTRTDLSYLRNTIKDSNIYNDCTKIFKQNRFKNTASTGPRSVHSDYNQHVEKNFREHQFRAPKSVCSDIPIRKPALPVLRDRFNNERSFLLPSQRFNRSVASLTIPESTRETSNKLVNQQKTTVQQNTKITISSKQSKEVTSYQTDSDNDCMFSQIANEHKNQAKSNKRTRDIDETDASNEKRTKVMHEDKTSSNIACNDFNFAKPSLPLKKSLGEKTKEVIVARSAPVDFKSPPAATAKTGTICRSQREESTIVPHNEITNDKQVEISQNSSSDVSMRPSFIKRKLFSQKLDVTEAKMNTDSSSESPQVDSYKSLLREKNKARKLVINNSCLNRDISNANNNLLDLIHRIVPAEQMNMTNVANQTNKNETKNTSGPDDKWDITTAISTCNNKDNVSDTFTDDELFCFNIGTAKKNEKGKEKENVKSNNQNEKTSTKNSVKKAVKTVSETPQKNVVVQKKISYSCVDNFFDTDYETDNESRKNKSTANTSADIIVSGRENMRTTETLRSHSPSKNTGLRLNLSSSLELNATQSPKVGNAVAGSDKANKKDNVRETAKIKELIIPLAILSSHNVVKNVTTDKQKNTKHKEKNIQEANKYVETVSDKSKAVERNKMDIISKKQKTAKETKQTTNVTPKVKQQVENCTNKNNASQIALDVNDKNVKIRKTAGRPKKTDEIEKTTKNSNKTKQTKNIEAVKTQNDKNVTNKNVETVLDKNVVEDKNKIVKTCKKQNNEKGTKQKENYNDKVKLQNEDNVNTNDAPQIRSDISDKNGKIQTKMTGKQKKTDEVEKITKSSKTQNGIKPDKQLNVPQSKVANDEAKANSKIEDRNTKNVKKSNTDVSKDSIFNNSRTRRIRTPVQKENIPISIIRTRSTSKTDKISYTQKRGRELKQVLQDSFNVLIKNTTKPEKKIKSSTLYPDISNTSMTLRSSSLQESDDIVKTNSKQSGQKSNKTSKTNKPKQKKNLSNTTINEKIQMQYNTSMNLRVRKNPRRDISYVY